MLLSDLGKLGFNECIYNTDPSPKGEGTLQKRGHKDSKSQKTIKPAMRVCFLEMKGDISIIWLPKQDLNKDSINKHNHMGKLGKEIIFEMQIKKISNKKRNINLHKHLYVTK